MSKLNDTQQQQQQNELEDRMHFTIHHYRFALHVLLHALSVASGFSQQAVACSLRTQTAPINAEHFRSYIYMQDEFGN